MRHEVRDGSSEKGSCYHSKQISLCGLRGMKSTPLSTPRTLRFERKKGWQPIIIAVSVKHGRHEGVLCVHITSISVEVSPNHSGTGNMPSRVVNPFPSPRILHARPLDLSMPATAVGGAPGVARTRPRAARDRQSLENITK